MKQRLQGILIGIMVMTTVFGSFTVYANLPNLTWRNIPVAFGGYRIYVDGCEFVTRGVNNEALEVFNFDGWLYAPFEKIAEALGEPVMWDADTRSLWVGFVPPGMRPVETVRLYDLNFLSERGGSWHISERIQVNTGSYYNHFIGRNVLFRDSISSRDYFLNNEYISFSGIICLSFDHRSTWRIALIRLYGDDKLLYTSNNITAGFLPQNFEIDVTGVTILRIEVQHNNPINTTSSSIASRIGIAEAMLTKR
jgi:hypothetical protein